MTNTQTNVVKLAKQGDVNSITFLISRSLQPKGVTARLNLKDGCLQIMLEAIHTPDQQVLVPLIHESIKELEIASIHRLKIYGLQTGRSSPCWNQEFIFKEQPEASISKLKSDQQLIECKGENGLLILTNTKVIIKRMGGGLSSFKKGQKTHINYADILDFQYQKSTFFSLGYIYFQVSGLGQEITNSQAINHKNAVTFLNDNKDFEKAREILVQKVNPHKYDNIFEGRSGTLVLTETGVIIKRSGGFLSGHVAGEKNIPYRSITAVQFKKTDLTVGFIQFTLKGGPEAQKGVFEAVSDENTVTFGTEEQSVNFERAKIIVEQRIVEVNNGNSAYSKLTDLDQLEKLASLKDKGIISEEEFQTKKKQILGL